MAISGFSPAGLQLGLGSAGGFNLGVDLQNQQIDESELLRRKRLQEEQAKRLLGVTGSAATASLFGSPLGGLTGGSLR
jgi:hypothetical protein